ncbi:hypothetical protein FRX31_034787 [Thalictrum thalictroides]|uniref:Uncharacterized protein n=1 Tax=Thalictrum thalictroides TaxID=46969 RepID=A0A7J6UTY5_THATH|nr:hypothetical protein FRX31_034787 [Thalictrum thalictroides]
MALRLRARSSFYIFQNILKAESVYSQRSIFPSISDNPNLATSQSLRNYATATGSKETKQTKLKPLPAGEEKELKETLQDIIGQGK